MATVAGGIGLAAGEQAIAGEDSRRRLRIAVLHEDRAVLALDKPAGWMLAPTGWQETRRNLAAAPEHQPLMRAFMDEAVRRWDMEDIAARVLASQRRQPTPPPPSSASP